MSYDIDLIDPVSKEIAKVPGHLMIGGTYKADYNPETCAFTPDLNNDASLNITYNYGRYYYEVFDSGIRHIYGMSGAESIPVLNEMINKIREKYMIDGQWIITKRERQIFFDKFGKQIINPFACIGSDDQYTSTVVVVDVSEEPNDDYWTATAGNAIRPLYQLIALATMRPDCIWDGN